MDIIPMIVRYQNQYTSDEPHYYPQIVMPNGTVWRGPSVGANLTQEQIDRQYGLLEVAVREHGLNPEEMGWTELTL